MFITVSFAFKLKIGKSKKSSYSIAEAVNFVTGSEYKGFDEASENGVEWQLDRDNGLPLSERKMNELTDSEESGCDEHTVSNLRYFHSRAWKNLVKDIDSALDERNYKALGMQSDTEDFGVEIKKIYIC